MAYYDVTKPITLDVDASQKGLGAALVQEKKTIAFASKTLTNTQSNYSNIEREMRSLVHGVERFHTYLYEVLHNHNIPQTLGDDLQQTNPICSASPAVDASQDPGL